MLINVTLNIEQTAVVNDLAKRLEITEDEAIDIIFTYFDVDDCLQVLEPQATAEEMAKNLEELEKLGLITIEREEQPQEEKQ